MKTYELTYIVSSAVTQEEAGDLAKEIESFVRDKEGVIIKSEKFSIQTLAYPIKKRSSGYFSVLEFQISEDKIKELKLVLDENLKIIRNSIIVKKPMKALKERIYRKPLFIGKKSVAENLFFIENKEKTTTLPSQAGKLDAADLDKKLDEILGE